MRLIPHGPEIPPDLIAAQEKGQTIFVCGAGVSVGAGLPLFRGLVEGVYQHLGEDWNLHPAEREVMRPDGVMAGQYDRVLRCLERRLAASDAPRNRGMRERIRSAVRHVLALPNDGDLTNHLALLELSRDAEGRNRILTTNFDTLFERAWFEKNHTAIASHAGMAMPQPKVAGCTGVLHLHGRLADPRIELNAFDTDLVLTSAEFGDAYLRSGWASRYVYDLVRAFTVVLVGYQADDPPMRYLLEALEADRERYLDLQKVYAFASCEHGNEDLVRALWAAKAVEPILYTSIQGDHSALYATLREWRKYAEDPTAWRRDQLRPTLSKAPDVAVEDRLQECVDLLGHGDACQLLGELLPAAEWLPVLVGRRVFDRDKELPGRWIAQRINDPSMISACAELNAFDEQVGWHVNRALEQEQSGLSPLREKAWRLLLAAKRAQRANYLDDSWYLAAPSIRRGKADFEARRLVSHILRPQLKIDKPIRWPDENRGPNAPEALHDLIRLDFDPADHPLPNDILNAWPKNAEQEIALFRTLDRVLLDALEEAQDAGVLDGWDRASYDVPSVAVHDQNAHRSGFYPITRTLADLWHRLAERDPDRARALVGQWAASSFLLVRRLSLFVHEHAVFTPTEAAAAVSQLDDLGFWGNGRVEIMRLLAARWTQFSENDRAAIETRICQGEPRQLYPSNAFDDEQEWRSVRDSSIYRRLKRIELAGGVLSPESQQLVAEISSRHPAWQPGKGDRDDFHSWHEMRSGPDGQPDLLDRVADAGLVKEAMRLQLERRYDQGDIWRVFCSADPERALRGLRLEADNGEWDAEPWRCLLWAANDKGDNSFQFELADLMLKMPDAPLRELLSAATSWLQRRRGVLSVPDQDRSPSFFTLWDRFADVAYAYQDDAAEFEIGDDLATELLNRPGGALAWSLLDALGSLKFQRNSGFSDEFKPRLDRLANAPGRPGLLARVYMVRTLAYLDAIDPAWVEVNLQPRLAWDHLEALPLWRSFAHGHVGSARLFNALKPAALAAFERKELSDDEFEGVMSNLLSVAIWHKLGKEPEYNLSTAEVRRALTVGPPSARRNVAWNFWRMMGRNGKEDDEEGEAGSGISDKPTRWHTVVGPLFRDIWPLDVTLRSKASTQNLVLMALECESAFPEAVDAILDVIVPYQLYTISHSLRLEDKHGKLVPQHPMAFLKLTNVLLDPAQFPVPNDLTELLRECVRADPTVVNSPAYVRLYGLRRQRNA